MRTIGFYSSSVRCVALAKKVVVKARPRPPVTKLLGCPRADPPAQCRYKLNPGFDTYPRPPYPLRANVTFVVVMPAMTKQTFRADVYKAIVHNAIVDLVNPAYAPVVYVRVRNAQPPSPPPAPPPRRGGAVRRPPRPSAAAAWQCTVQNARQGLVVHTVVDFNMIEREPISCFLRLFHSSRTPGSFAAPHWLQDTYGRSTSVHNVRADKFWLSAYRSLVPRG
jgi:hypothetical protein